MTQPPNALAHKQQPQGQEIAQRGEVRLLTLDEVSEITGYSPAEIALVSRTVAIGAPMLELAMFLKACRTLSLDPILRQAHWIRRKQPDGTYRGGLQVGIDGYRSLADRQGNYAGSEPAVFRGYIDITYKGKKYTMPEKATVACWKIVGGHKACFTGEARWTEFYPGEAQGFMWIKMPHHQLAKCAEGQGLRKGWPAQLGGVQMSPDMGENASGDLEEVGVPSHIVEQSQPAPTARPKATAADYNRIYASAYPDEQQSQPRQTEPDPEEPPEPESEEPTILEAESPVALALSRNKNLLDNAGQYHIPGLGKYKADESWPIDRIEAANTALGERVKERNGDAETAAKQDQVL